MTQFIQAIYEHGVFRPLEPVALPEHERVSLLISDVAPANSGEQAIQKQRDALARLRAEMDSLPREAPQDGLGGADADLILYGWKK